MFDKFKVEKCAAIKAARELFYDKYTIKELEEAKTLSEINRIMHTARGGKGN